MGRILEALGDAARQDVGQQCLGALVSTSIAPSARETSRMEYQTVAKIITHAEMVVMTKPVLTAQRGCTPVSPGTRNCEAMVKPAPIATTIEASATFSTPRISTASDADTR